MTPRSLLVLVISSALILLPVAMMLPGYSENSVMASNLDSQSASSTTGIMIPLYMYPTSPYWEQVIQAKTSNPSVPIIAIINPNSGPGGVRDVNYANGISSLRSAGVIVLGYVYTSYGKRSISSVETDVAAYHSWYSLDGIFFDEMTNVAGSESYYSALNSYSESLGYTMTVGNPGSPVPSSYLGTLSILCIYENGGLPSISTLSGSTSSGGKQNYAFMSYGVQSSDESFETQASSYVGWEFMTSAGLPNPYDSLPSYFSTEVSALNAVDKVQTASLVVQSFDLFGNGITGPRATIEYSNGSVIMTRSTPFNYTANLGSTYIVKISNSSNYKFDHWSNGILNSTMAVTPNGSLTLGAYFSFSGNSTTTTVSASSNSSSSTLTLNSTSSTTSTQSPSSSSTMTLNSTSSTDSSSSSVSTSSVSSTPSNTSSITVPDQSNSTTVAHSTSRAASSMISVSSTFSSTTTSSSSHKSNAPQSSGVSSETSQTSSVSQSSNFAIPADSQMLGVVTMVGCVMMIAMRKIR
ncbi:MAG TPA: spherulation-specific family 4 protein [Nitrososphaerales archaeon]|nr:spherulation-specific family 4 protein [Nitrososphaerales archaeon]